MLLLHNLAQADSDTAARLRRELPRLQQDAMIRMLGGLLHCPDVWASKAAALIALVLPPPSPADCTPLALPARAAPMHTRRRAPGIRLGGICKCKRHCKCNEPTCRIQSGL